MKELCARHALINYTVTRQLICNFVLAYAESRFSHDAAHNLGLFLFLHAFNIIHVKLGHFGHGHTVPGQAGFAF